MKHKLIRKSEYQVLCNSFERLGDVSCELETLKRKTKESEKIFRKIEGELSFLYNVYTVDNDCFYMFVTYLPGYFSTLFEIDIETKELDSDFKISYSNAEIKNNIMEIVSVDTYHYQRKGHASKHLQLFILLAKLFKLEKIYGDIWTNSSIPFENLCDFYRKNGFEIKGHKFYMYLKND